MRRTLQAAWAFAAIMLLFISVHADEKEQDGEKKKPAAPPTSGKILNLTPEQAEKAMTLTEGFRVTNFASEPAVRQPNAFCIDDRGRLWVGENYTYAKYGWQPDDRDQILIFEDTDGDGRFDKRKVFFDDFHYVSGIEVGYGGVWVGSPPNLLFIPDRDGDDIPDGEPVVVLDGWGREDQHETLNTFTWGPDGWLYGCHGVFTHSKVGKPGAPPEERQPLNAGVWRYHPVKDQFEVFAWGTSNPWGIDFDDHGQMAMTACVIPHLWHVIQGARYHRQAGQHFDKYLFNDIKTIAEHTHAGFAGRKGGHAHGGALLYLGESFPPEYRGKLLMCNIHHHNMYVDQFERKGSGLTGRHFAELMTSNDPWFLGFALQLGPDGAVFILDWYDEKECHGQTPEGKNTGRIYKVTYGQSNAEPVDLAKLDNLQLAKLQNNRNEWYVRHARRLLGERAAAGQDMEKVRAELRRMLHAETAAPEKLRALWALHAVGGTDQALLLSLTENEHDYVRAWAVQLEMEDRAASPAVLERYAKMAQDDPSPTVRLYLAAALQRLPLDQRWGIVEMLIGHEQDADDHNLPLMYWYGLEPLVSVDKIRALALATKAKVPVIRQYLARRAATQGDE